MFFPYLDILDLYLSYQYRRFNFLENDNPAGTISPLLNRRFVYLCNSSNVRLRFNMCICLNVFPFDLATLYTCQLQIINWHLIFFQLSIEMAKQFYACNWVPSRVTEEKLNGSVATGALAKKDVIHWRAPVQKILLNPRMEK